MHQRSAGKQFAGAALVHHADLSPMYQPHRVSMKHECSPASYLPGLHSCIMTTKGHSVLKHYATLRGVDTEGRILTSILSILSSWSMDSVRRYWVN